MSDRAYRHRVEADIARWQADGVIRAAAADVIRSRLPPVPEGVTVATVVAIVGGILIAAAFLAFVAANWTAIARPVRFAMLLAGIAGAYVIGASFDHRKRPYLADLAVAAGSIIFGAAIALVGQMYHLGEDFAAGMLLWATGALVAAALTGSRGALAVALVTACIWNGMRVFEIGDIHLPFVAFWLVAAGLAVMWNAAAARQLVAIAAVVWCVHSAIGLDLAREANPFFTVSAAASLLVGGGLALASRGPESRRALGLALSNYGAIALAIALASIVAGIEGIRATPDQPAWVLGCGVAGVILAFAATVLDRRPGSALAGVATALALLVVSGWIRPSGLDDPWLVYALALGSMLCLVVSGMLDDVRPRVVAGWIGLALVIAAITWAVRGSLLRRAAFLAAAGLVAVGLATLLGRLLGKERGR